RWCRWLVLVDWCCAARVVADYRVGGGGLGVAAGILAEKNGGAGKCCRCFTHIHVLGDGAQMLGFSCLNGKVNCKVTPPDGDIVSVLRPTENVLLG
nr:hypothetical protein [Tanacetum cinerariifolium]